MLSTQLIIVVALALTSCSSSPVDKAVAILDDAITKTEKATDAYELMGVVNTLKSDLNVINAAHSDYEPSEREARILRDKLNEFQQAYLTRLMELSYGDTPYGDSAIELINKMLPR